MFWACGINWWWWNIETAPPNHGLFCTMSKRGFLFVQTLQCAIVAFVQSPRTFNRDIEPHCSKCQLIGLHCPAQQAGVGNVEGQPGFLHGHPCGACLANSLFGQFHVVPASEQIELIPRALAVAKKDKGAGHGLDGRRRRVFGGVSAKLGDVTNVECL